MTTSDSCRWWVLIIYVQICATLLDFLPVWGSNYSNIESRLGKSVSTAPTKLKTLGELSVALIVKGKYSNDILEHKGMNVVMMLKYKLYYLSIL